MQLGFGRVIANLVRRLVAFAMIQGDAWHLFVGHLGSKSAMFRTALCAKVAS
ncbi:MAG: hypothetical protein J7M16_01795 [Anaerolineae bacterium]|nr:hypothetical protein [Anaerolineae bacterium]